eukprot:Nk52_evm13s284 gene=Nk52_evmTU13s284
MSTTMNPTTTANGVRPVVMHKVVPDGVVVGEEWSIMAPVRNIIMNSPERADLTAKLQYPIPEMIFGNSSVSLENGKYGFRISFSAEPALAAVDTTGEAIKHIKVEQSDKWFQSRNITKEMKEAVKPYDWTFTTTFKGDLCVLSSSGLKEGTFAFEKTPESIDFESLKQREPILFYEEVPMYEDDLGDFGMASLNVKIRVMPSGFFVLQRFYARVDGVAVIVNDTRLHHKFGKGYMLREFVSKEASFDELRAALPIDSEPSLVADVNKLFEYMKTKEHYTEKLCWV